VVKVQCPREHEPQRVGDERRARAVPPRKPDTCGEDEEDDGKFHTTARSTVLTARGLGLQARRPSGCRAAGCRARDASMPIAITRTPPPPLAAIDAGNLGQAALLLGSLALLVATASWPLLGGPGALLVTVLLSALIALTALLAPPASVLRLYGGRPSDPRT